MSEELRVIPSLGGGTEVMCIECYYALVAWTNRERIGKGLDIQLPPTWDSLPIAKVECGTCQRD